MSGGFGGFEHRFGGPKGEDAFSSKYVFCRSTQKISHEMVCAMTCFLPALDYGILTAIGLDL